MDFNRLFLIQNRGVFPLGRGKTLPFFLCQKEKRVEKRNWQPCRLTGFAAHQVCRTLLLDSKITGKTENSATPEANNF